MPKPKKYDVVFRKLREYDKRFVIYVNKGKGSHRMIFHPDVGGQKASYPIPFHGKELEGCYLKGIIRRFQLPTDFFD